MSDLATCLRCGYDLRGVGDDSPCPECGLLAVRSRRPSDALRDSRPGWLRSLSAGVWAILLAMFVAWVWAMTWQWLPYWAVDHWRWYAALMKQRSGVLETLVGALGFILAGTLLPMGALLFTRPEGYEPADTADRRRRRWIRMLAFLPLAAVLLMAIHHGIMLNHLYTYYYAVTYYSSGWRDLDAGKEASFITGMALLTIGLAPLPALLFEQLRGLARRAGSRHLYEHCRIVGIGASVTLAVGFWVILLAAYAEKLGISETWASRSMSWLLIMGLSLTAGVLFWLWTIYLMIRFAWSFARASIELKRAWRAADRSMGVES